MKFNSKMEKNTFFVSSIVINVSSTIVLLISISNDSPTDTRSMFSF